MKTTVKKTGDSQILLTVEIPATDVNQFLNDAAKALSMRINIPGFRKGSAPRSVVESKVGTDAVVDEFLHSGGLADLYARAVEDIDYTPIAQGDVEVEERPRSGKPFKFTAKIEVRPDVDLSGLNKIKVTKEKVSLTDRDVEREIDNLRDRFAEIKEADAKTVKKGLFALLDFEATVNKKPLEGGHVTDYLLEIGSNTFWPGFEEKLIGAKRGKKLEISVKVPADYFEKTMAGKTAKFKVNVKELKKKIVPSLDKEFAKKVGFESVEALKTDLKNNIRRIKENRAQEKFGGDVIQAATNAALVTVPQVLIDQYTDRIASSFIKQLEDVGASLEDYLASQPGMTLEKFKEAVAADGAAAAKSDLVLEAIARREKVEVNEKELDIAVERYINSMSNNAGIFTTDPDALNNRSRLRMVIKKDLEKAKAVEILVAQVEKQSKPDSTKSKPAKSAKAAPAGKKAKTVTKSKTDKEDKS